MVYFCQRLRGTDIKAVHSKKVFRQNIERARRAVEKGEELLKRYGSPLDKLTTEEIIAKVRKTREQLWEEKLAGIKENPMKTPQPKRTFKPDYEKAFKYLQKARERLKCHGSPLDSLSKEEIIQKVRKTREQLWEEKLATHH